MQDKTRPTVVSRRRREISDDLDDQGKTRTRALSSASYPRNEGRSAERSIQDPRRRAGKAEWPRAKQGSCPSNEGGCPAVATFDPLPRCRITALWAQLAPQLWGEIHWAAAGQDLKRMRERTVLPAYSSAGWLAVLSF